MAKIQGTLTKEKQTKQPWVDGMGNINTSVECKRISSKSPLNDKDLNESLVSGCIEKLISVSTISELTCALLKQCFPSTWRKTKNFALTAQLLLQIHSLQLGKKSHHTSTIAISPCNHYSRFPNIREKLRLYHLVTSDIPLVTMNLHNYLPKTIKNWDIGWRSIRKLGIFSSKPSTSLISL